MCKNPMRIRNNTLAVAFILLVAFSAQAQVTAIKAGKIS
jgi:hypothetical protein